MRQSINILHCSSQELVDFIHQQAVENPVLEFKENPGSDFSLHQSMKPS
ncbi:hypothetical protein ACF5W4_03815 [Bacillota bacterium Lsc_1132]